MILLKNEKAVLVGDLRLQNASLEKTWERILLDCPAPSWQSGEENMLKCGAVSLLELNGAEYAINIKNNGFSIVGKDFGGLVRGFLFFLLQAEETDTGYAFPEGEYRSEYRISTRMLHLCIFPEESLGFYKKVIRLSALCQYTHVILEPWGTLPFDCMPELSWPGTLTKADWASLIKEIREFGMEPVPQFNHLGHASQSRISFGKHTVLDQNPRLRRLFTPDGWAFDIRREEVRVLLKKVREELYELFGKGSYFHLGLDEAHFYTNTPAFSALLPAWFTEITDAVVTEGRTPIVWMDMMLEKGKYENCTASAEKEDAKKRRNALNEKTLLSDWQYNTSVVPIPTASAFVGSESRVLAVPWYDKANYAAHVETAVRCGYFGVIMTTWDTLREKLPSILGCAREMGVKTFPWSFKKGLREETATLLRFVSFEGNDYESAGFLKKQY